jgi:hypothetical protein
MEAEQKAGWNIFKQIFADHWEGFKDKYLFYSITRYNTVWGKRHYWYRQLL